jgi:hypothetical protein
MKINWCRVLQVSEVLRGKLAEDGKLKVRNEMRALLGKVANRLCSVWSNLGLERSAMGNIIGNLACILAKFKAVRNCTASSCLVRRCLYDRPSGQHQASGEDLSMPNVLHTANASGFTASKTLDER